MTLRTLRLFAALPFLWLPIFAATTTTLPVPSAPITFLAQNGPNLPLTEFSVDVLIQKMTVELHRQADRRNADAIRVYNDQVAYFNGPMGAGGSAPIPPLLELVNDDEIAAAMRGDKHWDQSKIQTYYRYVPPAAAPPIVVPVPTNPIGRSQGTWAGRDGKVHSYFEVVAGDPRPVGAVYANPSGWFQKISIPFPFGDIVVWQTIDPPTGLPQ